MVRNPTYRTSKYSSKLDGEVFKNRAEQYGGHQKRNYKLSAAEAAQIDREVKRMAGTSANLVDIPYYIIFGKEICSLKKRYEKDLLCLEVGIRYNKWRERGLNLNILNVIQQYYVPYCETCSPFTFNDSEFDSCDYLT